MQFGSDYLTYNQSTPVSDKFWWKPGNSTIYLPAGLVIYNPFGGPTNPTNQFWYSGTSAKYGKLAN